MGFVIGKGKEKIRFFDRILYIIKIVILNIYDDNNFLLLFRFMLFLKYFYIRYFI